MYTISLYVIIVISENIWKGVIKIMGFIDEIKAKAKADLKTIVLPETEDAPDL